MKTHFSRTLVLSLALAAIPAARADVDQALIPADAQWIVHVDLDTLRSSDLGTRLTAMLQDVRPELPVEGLRVDFEKAIDTASSITAYGTNFSQDKKDLDGTLVVQGTADLRKIIEGLITQQSVNAPDQFIELSDLPFEAYEVKGGVFIGFPPESTVVVSKSKEQLVRAHEIAAGKVTALAKKPSNLSRLLPQTGASYIVAASTVPSADTFFDQGDGPQARILRMARSAAVSIGESGDMTSAQVRLVAESDATATKLMKIMDGITAMISLTETSDQRLNEFLHSVSVTRNKDTVQVDLAYPTARLVEMIEGFKDEQVRAHQQASQHAERHHEEAPFPDPADGTVVAQWTADKQLTGEAPTPENQAVQTIDDVELAPGAIITVSGRRNAGENARIDYVEFAPAQGSGAPLRYEAEYMRLSNYRTENVAFASGGQDVIITSDRATARFQFQGAKGHYKVTVGYVDENDGASTFALSVKNPDTPTAPEEAES